ncbi:phage tail protein [Streptomyces klenkii]|uniref:phage tail protein n=1 Tax=Streptomyces klenkii TaxID=1420899 RepID=UPI00341AA8F4
MRQTPQKSSPEQAWSDLALDKRFRLSIDGKDLGPFTVCEGLACTVEVEEYAEGGNSEFSWYLPKGIKYPPIVLSRPVQPGVQKTVGWITSVMREKKRVTGEIAALRADGEVLARWGLLNVMPVSWNGPHFDIDSPRTAMESVEIVHHGFFEPGGR